MEFGFLEFSTRLGETVVLDASWNRAAHRDLATAVAAGTHSRTVALRCTATPKVVATRLGRRAHGSSDADEHIVAARAVDADPWPNATTIDTDATPQHCVEQATTLIRPRATGHPLTGDPRQI